MISLNQQEIKIGDTVKILEVSVTRQHRFVDGVVEGFANKQVVVRAEMRNHWGDRDDRVVVRYPEQVIVVNW